MNKFITVEKLDSRLYGGGTKANDDMVFFLKELDFNSFKILNFHSKIKKFFYAKNNLKKELSKLKNCYLVFQYPIRSNFITNNFLKYIKIYNIKLIILVHDISIQKKELKYQLSNEISLLNFANVVIVHNKKMKNFLEKNGVVSPMIELDIFDYNNPQDFQKFECFNRSICFAGNLEKSLFLTKLKSNINIYGSNKLDNYPPNVKYKGIYTPEELPKYLKENFGLIWDGDEITTCSGNFGKYLKFNNPHKASLYISSGIPVIVWSQAAIADFVKNNNLGVVVDNLNNIEEILNKISESEYIEMKKNVINVGMRLRKGYYIKNAVEKAIDLLGEIDE